MQRKKELSYQTESKVFASRLRKIMKECGENQTSLAEKIKQQSFVIQRQSISQYMSGQSNPDTDRLTAICKALNVSADFLLGLSDVASPCVTVQEMCRYTGLSETAVAVLHHIVETKAQPWEPEDTATIAFMNYELEDAAKNNMRPTVFGDMYRYLWCLRARAYDEKDVYDCGKSEILAEIDAWNFVLHVPDLAGAFFLKQIERHLDYLRKTIESDARKDGN